MTYREEHKYILEGFWHLPLELFELSEEDVLRHANLPPDLLQQKSPMVTGDAIYRIAIAIDELKSDDPTLLLRYIQTMTLDAFSPVTFACMCSKDLNTAARRIAKYKPIIGPARVEVNETEDNTIITIGQEAGYPPLPRFLVLYNLLSAVKVVRAATRKHVIPDKITVIVDVSAVEQYEAYFGVPIQYGDSNTIVFSAKDAQRPFLSPNPAMWSIFRAMRRPTSASQPESVTS